MGTDTICQLPIPPAAIVGAGVFLALLCLWALFRCLKRKRLVDDTPTSKTQGVFVGLTEVKGTAECETPLLSYLTESACVQYQWSVAEHWSRWVTESYTDSKGNRRTRTRRESGWRTVAEGGDLTAFYLQDDTGVLRIQPAGAKIEPKTILDRQCTPGDPLYYAKGPADAVANSDFRRRFSEEAIPLHVSLYVMGRAREREDVVAAEIADSPEAPLFLVSTRTEAEVSRSLGRWGWLWLVLGLLLVLGGRFVADHYAGIDPRTHQPVYVGLAVLYGLAVAVGWCWMVFNSLIALRQRVRQAWGQVEIQLKRRHDLIPSLVAVVDGFRGHEHQVQTLIAELRTQLQATPPGVAGSDFRGTAAAVSAAVEGYPELQADAAFLQLQKSLGDTEQRIALARAYFNDMATFYNIRLERIPDRFLAGVAAMKPQALMQAADFERAAVRVELAT